MSVTAVIPARYASSRYPGKPLLKETGKFLIQHVAEQVQKARRIERLIVATDDERIATAVRSFGVEVAMTRSDHPSGTDRLAEVLSNNPGPPEDLILNVQGDEPEIEPDFLDRLVVRMQEDPSCPMGTLACPFPDAIDPGEPNAVKVVVNRAGRALYFSRARIPYPRADVSAAERTGALLHLGVYAYRRSFLLQFAAWSPSALEQTERLEQLRALDNGAAILVEIVPRAAPGVDTPEDYVAFVNRRRGR